MNHHEIAEKLIKEVGEYLTTEQLILIQKAIEIAEEGHHGYERLDGSPYICHALGVARILGDWKAPADIIVAGLLHDVLKPRYSKLGLETLAENFSEDVVHLIGEINRIDSRFDKNSSDGGVSDEYTPEKKALWVRAMLHKSPRSLLVKIADRLHNARTLAALPEARRDVFAHNAINIFAAISHSLGMTRVMSELQDHCFRVINLDGYAEADQIYENARSDCRIQELAANLRLAFEQQSLNVQVIPHFTHRYGIHRQILKNNNTQIQPAEIVSFKIVTEDCYSAVRVIHHYSEFQPLNEFKDHIAVPKANGYRALHTRVIKRGLGVLNISIQTEEMYKVAELGVTAEWFGARINCLPVVKPLERAKEDWIMVFTPAGEVKQLPKNATVVDFAYAIHRSVGDRCTSAHINGEKAYAAARLQEGDVVEVNTGKGIAGPNPEWLDFVVTEEARRAIINYERRRSTIDFQVQCYDRVGVLSDISRVISTKGYNIKRFNSFTDDEGDAEILFRLEGVETVELEKIVQEIQRIHHIFNVSYHDASEGELKTPTKTLSIRDNPFSTQKPAMHTFKGRDAETAQVLRRLPGVERGNTLLIWGQKRSGKSFLLKYLSQQVKSLEGVEIVPIIIDVQGVSGEPIETFLHKIMQTISTEMAIPEISCPKIRHLRKNPLHHFTTFFDAFKKHRNGQNLLIMVDEFQGIEKMKDGALTKSDFFQALRNLIQHESNVSFIFSGGGTLKSLQKNLGFNSLMTAVDHIQLRTLEFEEGRSLIADTVEAMNVTDEAVQYLLDITGCHPCYIQEFCKHLYEEYACAGQEINLASVKQVVGKEMKGYGNIADSVSHFWQMTLDENQFEVANKNELILMAVADIASQECDWAEFCDIKNKLDYRVEESDLRLLLNELTDYGSLTKEQNRYRITIPLFCQWLQNVKPFNEINY